MNTFVPAPPAPHAPKKAVAMKQIPHTSYVEIRDLLIDQLIADRDNERIKTIYGDLTGDHHLEDFKDKLVRKEINDFTNTLYADSGKKISVDDSGYDNDTFYIRFCVSDMEFLKLVYKDVMDFLQNVADRTGVEVSPEFQLYTHLAPSKEKAIEVIEAPKFKNLINLELNEK